MFNLNMCAPAASVAVWTIIKQIYTKYMYFPGR